MDADFWGRKLVRAYCRFFGHRAQDTSWRVFVPVGPYDWFCTGRECERCEKRRARRVRLVRKVA